MTEARAEQLREFQEIEQRGRLDGERQGRLDGERQGRLAGVVLTLLHVYEQRLGAPPESVRGALSAIGDADRLDAMVPLFINGSADDIARTLLP